MRIKVRDFWTMIGLFISSMPIIMIVIGGDLLEGYWYCSGASLLVGIPMLIIGLRMQAKYYGDNRMVKWVLLGWPIGLLLGFLLIRCSTK